MKTLIVIILMFPLLLKGQIYQSDCAINNDSIYSKLENAAEYITYNFAYEIQDNTIDSIEISVDFKNRFREALISIYNIQEDFLLVDTIFNIHKIEPYPYIILNKIELSVDSTTNWLAEIRNGNIPTGYSEIDNLIENYDLTLSEYYEYNNWFDHHVIILDSYDNYNVNEFLGLFDNLEGLTYSHIVGSEGDGNHITGSINENITTIVFSRGWHGCPLGCIFRQYWEFNVYSDCTVEYLRTYGTTTDTKNILDNSLKIYPNPIRNSIFIENTDAEFYEICDLNGKTLIKETLKNKQSEINLRILNNGVYVFKLQSKNKINSTLIIKQE